MGETHQPSEGIECPNSRKPKVDFAIFIQVLFALGILLLLLDAVVPTDYPAIIGLGLLAAAGGMLVPVPVVYRAVIAVLLWGGLMFVWYALLRSVIRRLSNRLAPDSFRSSEELLIGCHGRVERIEGKDFVRIGDKLFQLLNSDFSHQQAVIVISAEDGRVRCKAAESSLTA